MATATVEKKELIQLEKEYWRALKDRDVSTAMRLTDFPCLITGPQGVGRVDKQAFAEMMKDPPYTIHKVEVSDDAQVRMLQDDVAVLAYQVHEELTVDGKPVAFDAADSSTWVRRDGRWLCALHTEAIAGDAFGRDRAGSTTSTGGPGGAGTTTSTTSSSEASIQDDERAIRRLVGDWFAATRAGDWTKVLSLMADDVVFMTPDREPFGKKEFAEATRSMHDLRIEGTSELKELTVRGDWAWYRSYLTVTMTPPDGRPKQRSGYVLTIARKKPDGSWVIARDANLLPAM